MSLAGVKVTPQIILGFSVGLEASAAHSRKAIKGKISYKLLKHILVRISIGINISYQIRGSVP